MAVSKRHPPRSGGSGGREEGRVIFDSEYADRGEWLFAAFGEGSRDSKENFRACRWGVDGTELDWWERVEL
jgi:hypothetical protein